MFPAARYHCDGVELTKSATLAVWTVMELTCLCHKALLDKHVGLKASDQDLVPELNSQMSVCRSTLRIMEQRTVTCIISETKSQAQSGRLVMT